MSTTIVESELARSRLSDIADKKSRSFSNLNGMIAKDRTFLPSYFAADATMGETAAPAFPARFANMIMVE